MGMFNKPKTSQHGAQPLDQLIRKEVALGVIKEIVKPEDHIGLNLFPFYEVPSDDYIFSYVKGCLLYTSPSPRDRQKSRMPSSA